MGEIKRINIVVIAYYVFMIDAGQMGLTIILKLQKYICTFPRINSIVRFFCLVEGNRLIDYKLITHYEANS